MDTLVLLTGLPLTIGHQYLIDFALEFDGQCHVLLNSRPQEPIPGIIRANALVDHYYSQLTSLIPLENRPIMIFKHYEKDVPQNPSEHDDFWNFWRDLIFSEFPDLKGKEFAVVASEQYGKDLSDILGASFIPCDIARQVFPSKATSIRQNPLNNFNYLMDEMKPYFKRRVIMTGVESAGKTTMSKSIARDWDWQWVPEYAREYLETVGKEITDDKMNMIAEGQKISQEIAFRNSKSPFIIQDTDLISTIGYWRIWKGEEPEKLSVDHQWAYIGERGPPLYIVMNENIPFEADPLRYGGSVRESKTDFWIKILDEYGCEYYIVQKTDFIEQYNEIMDVIYKWYYDQFKDLMEFVRT